ncbi:hypothetical protein DBR11_11945 [Pedobacter sp. HMWF019]|uniref:hypothetical protein n=1 Tax=Pedobacter sp. HMWF019 TaxID=2056856 RepID=UPI000D397E91|nr:hypothetical protein [Pedobacter sp. HMWF019]PTS99641.1 hypothetical protein DBR11_11945 [Pedobacter sp. HMWF019]
MLRPDSDTRQKTVIVGFNLGGSKRTVVPFGVADFHGRNENSCFTFEYSLERPVNVVLLEIRDATDQLLYQCSAESVPMLPGIYQIHWDGFDKNGIYDSRRFDHQSFYAKLTVIKDDAVESEVLKFGTRYKEVSWIDVKINRPIRTIQAILRTAFEDLGTMGEVKVPTKTYEDLLVMAIEGMKQYWSRSHHHPEGKSVHMPDGEGYEFYLEVENSTNKSIPSPGIVYNSQGRLRRSRNWELSRILYYNTGALKVKGKWLVLKENYAAADFKHTAAHEIGHEILLAYGGHRYSKAHKGSSTIVTQAVKGNFLYPQTGEIDLMIYYGEDEDHPYPPDYNKRSVASEKDVLGLVWLSKIEYFLVAGDIIT